MKFFSPSQQYYYSIDLKICQEFFYAIKKNFFELLLSLKRGDSIGVRLMKSKNGAGLACPLVQPFDHSFAFASCSHFELSTIFVAFACYIAELH